jgi:hypothetical protein
MKVRQLNEFLFKSKKNQKLKMTANNGTVKFSVEGFSRVLISKVTERNHKDFGKYETRADIKGYKMKKTVYDTLSAAISAIVKYGNDKISQAKSGKTETSPADAQKLTIEMFDKKAIEKHFKR